MADESCQEEVQKGKEDEEESQVQITMHRRDGAPYLLHVDKQTRQVIERDVVLDAVQHCLHLQPIKAGALGVQRNSERLYLHHLRPVVGQIDLGFEVDVIGERVVQDVHRRELRGWK